MIDVDVIASGSKGNCYRLKSGDSSLLLEAGVPLSVIKEAIDYKMGAVEGCLISHEHKDHALCYRQLEAAGVELYMSKGTKKALGLSLARELKPMEIRRIGKWFVMGFHILHDAEEPMGFYISDGEDYLLFATDTYWIQPTFKNLTLIMLECNYIDNLLEINADQGIISPNQAARVAKSHMSLANMLRYLDRLDLSHVRKIYAIHMSSRNCVGKYARELIKEHTGKPVVLWGGKDLNRWLRL